MIIFFSGADGYRSREKFVELKQGYLEKNPDATGFFEFDFTDGSATETLGRFFETVETQGLFASKKFVVARNTLLASESVKQSIREFLEQRGELAERASSIVILFWESSAAKKTDKLAQIFAKTSLLQQTFEPLTGDALRRWALVFLKKYNPPATISQDALDAVITEAGSDLFRLEAELSKLASYTNGDMIGIEQVRLLVASESLRDTVFAALDALAAGDKAKALRLLAERTAAGENALGLLALCAWQLRTIFLVADAYHGQGLRAADAIARVTGLKPFQVNKTLRRINRFPLPRLRRGFALLSDLDGQAKSGGLDPDLALEMFVMKF